MLCRSCTRRIALTGPNKILRSTTLSTTLVTPSSLLLRSTQSPSSLQSKRTFTSLPPKRPLLPSSTLSSLPTTLASTTLDTPTSLAGSITSALGAITPGGSLQQVRGAKRDTFNPSHRVRKRRHGFLSRIRTRNGRALIKRRRVKGRSTVSH